MSKARPTPISAPLDGALLVEASAGTGKTHTLTTLAARLVVEARRGIEDLLIVTFTVAATGELRTRIWQTLHAARDAVRDDSAVGGGQARELAAHWRGAGIDHAEARLDARHPRLRPRHHHHHPRLLPARAGRVRAPRQAPIRVPGKRRRGAGGGVRHARLLAAAHGAGAGCAAGVCQAAEIRTGRGGRLGRTASCEDRGDSAPGNSRRRGAEQPTRTRGMAAGVQGRPATPGSTAPSAGRSTR